MFTSRRLLTTRTNLFVPRKERTLSRSFGGYPLLSQAKQQFSQHQGSRAFLSASFLAFGACLTTYNFDGKPQAESSSDFSNLTDEADETTQDVINWSGTHKVTVENKNFFEPETVEEVEAIIRDCNERKQTVRPLGSSLSPNGIALNSAGMISMANLDKVLKIDTENNTVTVQAGITVQRVRTNYKCNSPVSRIESR